MLQYGDAIGVAICRVDAVIEILVDLVLLRLRERATLNRQNTRQTSAALEKSKGVTLAAYR